MVFCNIGQVNQIGLSHCHNPYFNRWFSAIQYDKEKGNTRESHNPYFNRWFSAISVYTAVLFTMHKVTILILIDGFLQYNLSEFLNCLVIVTILILIDGFLQ